MAIMRKKCSQRPIATSHLCQVITPSETYSPFYFLSRYYFNKHLHNSYFVLEVLVAVREVQLNGLRHMTGVQLPARGVRHGVQTGHINLLHSGNGHRSGTSCSSVMSNMEDFFFWPNATCPCGLRGPPILGMAGV